MPMEKKEHTTYLSAGTLVGKNSPRVEFRGRLDSLAAAVVELQILAQQQKRDLLIGELEEIREKIYDIIACEVRGEPCADLSLWGLDSDEIRERSHQPEKHFGLGHIRPHYTMGILPAALNKLRTQVRETELAACRAFDSAALQGEPERPDILKVLNRLSSAVYILTYRYLPEGYDKTVTFGKRKNRPASSDEDDKAE